MSMAFFCFFLLFFHFLEHTFPLDKLESGNKSRHSIFIFFFFFYFYSEKQLVVYFSFCLSCFVCQGRRRIFGWNDLHIWSCSIYCVCFPLVSLIIQCAKEHRNTILLDCDCASLSSQFYYIACLGKGIFFRCASIFPFQNKNRIIWEWNSLFLFSPYIHQTTKTYEINQKSLKTILANILICWKGKTWFPQNKYQIQILSITNKQKPFKATLHSASRFTAKP